MFAATALGAVAAMFITKLCRPTKLCGVDIVVKLRPFVIRAV